MSKDRSVYLLHALDCIDRIERYTAEGAAVRLNIAGNYNFPREIK